jgi:hypothetical protein
MEKRETVMSNRDVSSLPFFEESSIWAMDGIGQL